MSFLFIDKTLLHNNFKTRTAMNAKISVFAICVAAIIYLLLYNLHDCTFNCQQIYALHTCFHCTSVFQFELWTLNLISTTAILLLFFFDVADCWFYTASIYSFLDFYFMWNPSIVVSKNLLHKVLTQYLTLSWRRPLSYKNQFIDLLFKSVDWFLYNNALHHERVK